MTHEPLRTLTWLETGDIYLDGGVQGRVRISHADPVTGELVRDSAGLYFLTPEKDLRGPGMGAVRIRDLPADAMRRLVGRVVKVSGTYEQARGLQVDQIVERGKDE